MDDDMPYDTYLYGIEFSDGVVKVGRTTNPKVRRKNHATDAGLCGARITRHWQLGPHRHEDACQGEAELIRFCSGRWTSAGGREYFASADLLEIAEYAIGIDDILRIFEGRAEHLLHRPAAA